MITIGLILFYLLSIISIIIILYSVYNNYDYNSNSSGSILSNCYMSYYHVQHKQIPIYSKSLTIHNNMVIVDENNHLPFNSYNNSLDSLYDEYTSISLIHSSNYKLYRYFDPQNAHSNDLHYRPILFIPGSSGNYHQSRSVLLGLILL
jgi:hypothetical protein